MRLQPLAVLVLSLSMSQLAHAAMPEKDLAKGQDHSLVTRFQGSKLVG
jgi:hypothetical protein